MSRDKEAEAEIERIERIFADPDFKLEECYEYIDPDDFVGFDFMPPIVKGREHWKQHVGGLMDNLGSGECELVRLEVSAGSDHGFANSILNIKIYDKDGAMTFSGDLRQTICYRKKNGRWYQVSQHASVPVNMQTGQPIFQNSW